MPHEPATVPELRWIYRMGRLAERGINFEQALNTPCLRATLELGVTIRRKRRELSTGRQPDLFRQ